MRRRPLPRTDVSVSEVGFAVRTVSTGRWDDDDAIALLRAALDLGVTLYDVPPASDGRAEALLARAFAGRRDDVVHSVGVDGRAAGWSPEWVRAECTRAIARLGSERIDVLRLHDPPARALRSRALLAVLDELVAEGTIRGYAASAVHNALEPEGGRRVIAEARDAGLGLIVRDPHCSGMLEGKYTAETAFPPGDPRSRRPDGWLAEGLRAVEGLRALTEGRPHTLGQAALKWALADPVVVAVLPDVYGPGQLEEFAAAPDLPDLEEDDLARIAALSPAAA